MSTAAPIPAPVAAPVAAQAPRARPEGHRPTLVAAFLHFDVSFMLWVLLGALGIFVAEEAGLSAAGKGLLVAVPILSGSLLRVPLGLAADRYGARRVGAAMLAFLFLPLGLGWRAGGGLPSLLAVGLMLGTAGASFAVALPLAGRWYPAERQGLVMGIAAAGNSGTVIANLAAPRLARVVGWHGVLGLAMIPLALVLVAFLLLARESPERGARKGGAAYLAVLRQRDLWWYSLFYGVTFGGYVGLSGFLPLFFRDQYGAAPVTAGYLTALGAVVGSGVRPLGGWLADRLGGARLLGVVLAAVALGYAAAGALPALPGMVAVVVATMACLGLGNGAVFQLVPQRFRAELGVATGVVGALGGVGGFLLPLLLGAIKQTTGSFAPGFAVMAGVAALALAALRAHVGAPRRALPVEEEPAVARSAA
jgi:NNP family nitrate/nitrite transporter-like MFS transporter